jgi:hypothetical protein
MTIGFSRARPLMFDDLFVEQVYERFLQHGFIAGIYTWNCFCFREFLSKTLFSSVQFSHPSNYVSQELF